MENLRRVAILLNNIAVEILLETSNPPLNAVTTLRDAMELIKYAATGTYPPNIDYQQLLDQAQARQRGGNDDDMFCQPGYVLETMVPVVIQDPDDCAVSVASCVIVFNYGLALECVSAADTAVYHIFLLASTLLETCADEDSDFLDLYVIGKLMQVSQRLGLEEDYAQHRHSFIGLMTRKEEQQEISVRGSMIAPAA